MSNKKAFYQTMTIVIFFIGMVIFGYLYVKERKFTPHEIIKEIPKEVIIEKEVPVEVIIEKKVPYEVIKEVKVPAEIPDEYKLAYAFYLRSLYADRIYESSKALKGIGDFGVYVYENDAVKEVISKEAIKNKFELFLRRYGVKINDLSRNTVSLGVEGLWDKDEIQMTYSLSVSVDEIVILYRGDETFSKSATIWESSSYGYAGSRVLKDAIIRGVEEKAESFVNTYLAANQ